MKNDKINPQYDEISKRDGEFCKICQISSHEIFLSIANKINSENINIENQFLICSICLSKRQLYQLCVRESKKIKTDEGFVTELQVNRRKEARFRLYVYEKISESKNLRFEESDLINSTAEEIGISPITARRYLNKICSSAGVLTRIDNGDDTFVEFSLKREDFQ